MTLNEQEAMLLVQAQAMRHVLEKLLPPECGFVLVLARLEQAGEFTAIRQIVDASNLPEDIRAGIHQRMAAPEQNAQLIVSLPQGRPE